MKNKFARLPILMLILAASAGAATITSFDVRLGSWDGSTFTGDGAIWNTTTSNNWAVGATAPGYNNPVLDGYQSVNLPDGEYWLYMAAYGDSGNAIQITLGYSTGNVVEVFTAPTVSPEYSGPYTLVSGSGFSADLITGPQTTYTAVGQQQVYSSTGAANFIVDLNAVPEPGSWILLMAGLGALVFARRKRAA